MLYTTEKTHISMIKCGDTVVHKGILSTVCSKDIQRDSSVGLCLFGDCYKLGTKPILKAIKLKEFP